MNNFFFFSILHFTGPKLELDNCRFGKFAAIVKIEVPDVEGVAADICQHILGMNPKSIGEWEVPKEEPVKKKKKNQGEEEKKAGMKEEEDVLLNQEFLLDPQKTVKEYLQDNGPKVVDFVRLQCGEELDED